MLKDNTKCFLLQRDSDIHVYVKETSEIWVILNQIYKVYLK